MVGLIVLTTMSILCLVASYAIWPEEKIVGANPKGRFAQQVLSLICGALACYFGLGAFSLYVLIKIFRP